MVVVVGEAAGCWYVEAATTSFFFSSFAMSLPPHSLHPGGMGQQQYCKATTNKAFGEDVTSQCHSTSCHLGHHCCLLRHSPFPAGRVFTTAQGSYCCWNALFASITLVNLVLPSEATEACPLLLLCDTPPDIGETNSSVPCLVTLF